MPAPLATLGPADTPQTPLELLPASNAEVLSATFEDAFRTNPLQSSMRWYTLPSEEDGNMVSAEEARAEISAQKLPLQIPDAGISRAKLDVLKERKIEELQIQEIMSRSKGGFLMSGAQLGVGLGASFLDPINILSGFIPVLGINRYRTMVQGATGALGRARVRARVGALEGAVGATAVEPIVYFAAQAEQADYDMYDSLVNVAFGAVLGAGLHTGIGSLKDSYKARKLKNGDIEINVESKMPDPLSEAIESLSPNGKRKIVETSLAMESKGYAAKTREQVNFIRETEQANKNLEESVDSSEAKADPKLAQKIEQLKQERLEVNQQVDAINESTGLKLPEIIEKMTPEERTVLAKAEQGIKSKQATDVEAAQKEYNAIVEKASKRLESEQIKENDLTKVELESNRIRLDAEIKSAVAEIRRKVPAKEGTTPRSSEIETRLNQREMAVRTEQAEAMKPENLRVYDKEALNDVDKAFEEPEAMPAEENIDSIVELENEARAEAESAGVKYEDFDAEGRQVTEDLTKALKRFHECSGGIK